MYAFYFCCDLNKLLINNDSVSVLGNRENAQGVKFGNFLENYFWPPPPPINFVHGSYRKCLNFT